MELTLTEAQRKYLDKKGIFTAKELQATYKKSVQEQQTLIKAASKLRARKSR